MTDLFDSLTSRFTPGTQPVIRPRPQLRFEGTDGPDTLTEEEGFETARTPQPPPASPRQTAAQPPDTLAQTQSTLPRSDSPSTDTADVRKDASSKGDRGLPEKRNTKSDTSRSAPDRRGRTQRAPDPDGSSSDPIATTHSSADPEQPQASQERAPQNMFREVQADEPRARENVPLQTIETRIVETTHEVQQPSAPEPAQASTTIRIGRIEMRQPAPPAQPAPPPASPRRAAPAPAAKPHGTMRGASSSGLTDYLGWKRR